MGGFSQREVLGGVTEQQLLKEQPLDAKKLAVSENRSQVNMGGLGSTHPSDLPVTLLQ